MRNYNDDVIEDSFLVFIPALHPTHLPAVPVCVIVSGYKHLIMIVIVRSSYRVFFFSLDSVRGL